MTTLTAVFDRSRPATATGWVPISLALVAVLIQMAYPRVQGTSRDVATIAIVVLFASASLSHALIHHGPRVAARIGLTFAGGGLAVELIGVATGLPFGAYIYSARIGPMVGGVPLLIPLAWLMLGYPALVVGRLTTRSRLGGSFMAAVALATWDLFLDPQMVAEGYWTWNSAGPHLIGTIPATNYLAWLATAWVMMTAVWSVTDTGRWGIDRSTAQAEPSPGEALLAGIGDGHSGVPVALYVWTWLGSTVAHLFYFDLIQSGLYGLVGMGAVVTVLAWSLLRRMGPDRATIPAHAHLGGPTSPADGHGRTA